MVFQKKMCHVQLAVRFMELIIGKFVATAKNAHNVVFAKIRI